MSYEISTLRLNVMRLLYLLNFAMLGLDVWPAIVSRGGTMDPIKGVAFAFWGALSLLSGLGLRYPLRMLPLLLMQLVYKLIWVVGIALPQWSTIQADGLVKAMVIGLVVDVLVIPWSHVLNNYVKEAGDRWRSVPRPDRATQSGVGNDKG